MVKKQSKLLTIYDNIVLRDRVDKALDEDADYQNIVDICKEYNIEVSTASITRYAQKRAEAIKTGQDLRELLDTDTSRTLANIKKKQVDKPATKETPEPEFVMEDEISAEVMLNKLIKKGYGTLINDNVNISVKDFTALVKLYTQINGNNNHGLTTEGLQQLRLFQHALNIAMVNIITKYISPDKQKEVLEELKAEEEKQYATLNNSMQGKALLKALNIGNFETPKGDNEDE